MNVPKKPAYKILAGCCVRQEPHVLAAYLRSLRALLPPVGVTLNFGFIDDGGHAAQLAELEPAVVLPAEQARVRVGSIEEAPERRAPRVTEYKHKPACARPWTHAWTRPVGQPFYETYS